METILIRVAEAARLLQLSRSKVYLMINTGELPAVRIGKAVRIPSDALRKLVETAVIGK